MSAQTPTSINYPTGVRLDLWGPTILPNGKFYVFQGETKPIPFEWTDLKKFLQELKFLEQLNWAYSLPEEREALFLKKLHMITRDLPTDWTIVLCTVASGVIIFVGVISAVRSQLAKL
jgi:hypothetical protein